MSRSGNDSKKFNTRRLTLLAKMAPYSAAVIFSAPEAICSRNLSCPYRQNSNFWYLIGFKEPESVLVLIKKDENRHCSVLFNRAHDLESDRWFGRRLGQDAAPSKLGVDRALPFNEINQNLHLILSGLRTVYHAQGEYEYADIILYTALDKLRRENIQENLKIPISQIDWRPWVHEMRMFKSSEELEIMRRAAKISASAHTRAMKKCRPYMFEYQLEAEIHYEFTRLAARYPSYNTIVGSGENSCILHYNENERLMRDGDLVLIDAGCEYQRYASDITRTFPVNGKFSQPQRAIYDLLLTIQLYALKLFKPGTSIRAVNDQVVLMMIQGLRNLGIIQGTIEQLIINQAHLQFYMHGLSHWLGLDVHDVNSGSTKIQDRVLEPGMVMTVEPGLYIAPDADVPKEYRGIGIRIEDDILITVDGNENLTASVVKNPDAIEALMASDRSSKWE